MRSEATAARPAVPITAGRHAICAPFCASARAIGRATAQNSAQIGRP
jgi:hypothetical protein